MGLFDRFFKKKEEIEEYIISLDQAPEWYDKQITPKKYRLNQKIKQTKQKIIQNTQEVKQKLEKLHESGLLNPNIPERAKHFLQGNKEAYTKKVNSFLDALILPEEVEDLGGFFKDFNVQIQNLAQGIARPIQILNEFLANETREVSFPLGNIEKEIQKLKDSVEKLKLNEIDATKEKITNVQNQINKEKELTNELNTIIKEINKNRRENEQLDKQIELLQKDKELNQAKEQKQEIKERINQMQKELIESFSIIETALKKYEHITFQHKELIGKYLESPIDALMKDLHLDVIKMFSDLANSAEAGKLEMKPRKTTKTIEEIKKLDKEKLGKFLTEYGQLHLQHKNLQEDIAKMDVVLVAKEKEKKKEKNLNKLNDLMSKMNYLQTELGKIDIDALIKELTTLLGEKCFVKLTISLTPLVKATSLAE